MLEFISKVFPGVCVICDSYTHSFYDICFHCKRDLVWNEVNADQVAIFHYQKPIDKLLIGLKFNKKLVYARVLGELMAERLQLIYADREKPEIIIPVPLHKKRLKERGFNQSVQIALPISKKLDIKINTSICRRIKNTKAQSLISVEKRKNNVKNAFEVNFKSRKPRDLKSKHIAIIDDVITTGNTVKNLKKTLLDAGFSKIDVWCCAKTDLH